MDGFLGGGQLGYNFQNGNIVLGPEVTIAGGDVDGRSVSTQGAADDNITTSLDLLVTAVARVGYASDNWLLYANGGWAGSQIDMSVVDNIAPNTGTWSNSAWHNGYTVGAGVEYARGQAIFGLEYRYMDLGSTNHSAVASTGQIGAFDVDVSPVHSLVGRVGRKLHGLPWQWRATTGWARAFPPRIFWKAESPLASYGGPNRV
ncbi:outer membrane beta-barrel protein [Nitratireductor sp. XY-223]|uniref:outer membrane protein n=1 Tax=Nitratireductor sp. XY-223 TaxID=2561926 RepID=UPI0010AA52D4|nr:outer membrane beta-barrel protein [Nitratireductor sp. XY-223]